MVLFSGKHSRSWHSEVKFTILALKFFTGLLGKWTNSVVRAGCPVALLTWCEEAKKGHLSRTKKEKASQGRGHLTLNFKGREELIQANKEGK